MASVLRREAGGEGQRSPGEEPGGDRSDVPTSQGASGLSAATGGEERDLGQSVPGNSRRNHTFQHLDSGLCCCKERCLWPAVMAATGSSHASRDEPCCPLASSSPFIWVSFCCWGVIRYTCQGNVRWKPTRCSPDADLFEAPPSLPKGQDRPREPGCLIHCLA